MVDYQEDARARRAELLRAEIALKDQIERVAALRRSLPLEPVREDYAFMEGPPDLDAGDEPRRTVRLSELFDRPEQTLVLVHFMFGGRQTEPCPMCTMWADGYDGVVPHLRQRIGFGVVVAGDPAVMRREARARGWRHLRFLSSAGTTFKRDFGMEDADGAQRPGVSVFRLGEDGRPRHFYTQGALMAPGHWRGMDLLSPVWSFLDLTPEGRGEWMPRRRYAQEALVTPRRPG
jgi:predicted dithiol-disulfide oxidoreductase (DUF899 family)